MLTKEVYEKTILELKKEEDEINLILIDLHLKLVNSRLRFPDVSYIEMEIIKLKDSINVSYRHKYQDIEILKDKVGNI